MALLILRPRARAVVLALPFVAACSLFTSLDGLSGGDDDGPSPDGALPEASLSDRSDDVLDAGPRSDAPANDGGAYRDLVLGDEPLGYWRLDDTGATARDEMGAHPGVYKGTITSVPGLVVGDGQAKVFAGSSYVDFGNEFGFLDRAAWSLEAWVSTATSYPDTGCIIAKNVGPQNGGSPTEGWALYVEPTPDAKLDVSRWHNSNEEGVVTTALVMPAKPTHVVATYDGATITAYIDGTAVGAIGSTASIVANPSAMTVGASRGGSACRFRGTIDEVAVYGVALSSDRIAAHFRAGKGQ